MIQPRSHLDRPRRSRPRVPPPHSQLAANDKAYTSDSELTQVRPSYRNSQSLRSPGSGFRDDDMITYQSSPARLRGSGRHRLDVGTPQGGGRWKRAPGLYPQQQQRFRYFVALYNYNPLVMSPNKESAHEEIAFREADVRLIFSLLIVHLSNNAMKK